MSRVGTFQRLRGIQGSMVMRRVVGFLAVLSLLAACGGDVEPTTSAADITVEVGRDLGLGPADRILPALSVGVWKGAGSDGVVRISERHLVGDEAGAGHRIILDFNQDPLGVVEISLTRDDADGGASAEPAGPGTLVLQDADPSGLISGEFSATEGRSFRFWVDISDAAYVERRGRPGEVLRLRPGGVVDSFRFATQYLGVVEDSRCPQDAECVWEGTVVVAMRFVWESGTEDFELAGLHTAQGSVYGDSPTHALTVSEFSTEEIALVGLDGDVATFEWVSTG